MIAPGGSIRFDRAADYYDETRGLPPGVDDQAAALVAQVARLSASSAALEIGVGTGRIALPMARHVRLMCGIDLSRPMLARLRSKPGGEGVRAAQGDATRLPFPAAAFDMALAVHVFHLIPDYRRVLAEVARVLRPGGVLVHAGSGRGALDLWEVWRERTGIEQPDNVGVPRSRITTFPADEGWRPATDEQRLGFTHPFTPAMLVRLLENRMMSHMWRMSDEEVARGAAAMRELVAGRFADPEQPVEAEGYFVARAWLPPGP